MVKPQPANEVAAKLLASPRTGDSGRPLPRVESLAAAASAPCFSSPLDS